MQSVGNSMGAGGNGKNGRKEKASELVTSRPTATETTPLKGNRDDVEKQQKAAAAAAKKQMTKDKKREEYQERIRSKMDFSLNQCLLAILGYIVIAIVAYSYVFEKWSIIDSMYFAVITFTTIGYGDLTPTTVPGRVFTAIYALTGVSCLGIALGVLGSNLIEAEQAAMEQAKKSSEKNALKLFDEREQQQQQQQQQAAGGAAAGGGGGNNNQDGKPQHHQEQHHHQKHHGEKFMPPPQQPHAILRSTLNSVAMESGIICVIVIVFAGIMAVDPNLNFGWDIGTTIYFAIITSCTVGYGDIAPASQVGRLMAVIFIPLAVGAMGHWLSVVASTIIDQRQSHFRESWRVHQLTEEDLEVMDDDGDGNVTRAEFFEFMLVAMDMVDQETIDELTHVFNMLDNDGSGSLSREDLLVGAKNNLRKTAAAAEGEQQQQQAE